MAPAKAQRLEGWGSGWAYLGALAAQPHLQLCQPCGLGWHLGIAMGDRGVRAPWARSPEAAHPPPRHPCTLTMRSCIRAFRWSPLVLAWAAATQYRSIRCSSASSRVRGGEGTSGPDRNQGLRVLEEETVLSRSAHPECPSSLPGTEGTVAGVGG